MKPGIRTTEFWATLIALIVPILQALGVHVVASPLLAQSIAGVATVGYTIQRAVLKHQFTAITLSATSTVIHKFVGEIETPAVTPLLNCPQPSPEAVATGANIPPADLATPVDPSPVV